MSICPPTPSRSFLCRAVQHSLQSAQQYQQSALLLTEAGLLVVSHAFRFTAAQEREHAAILQGLLPDCAAAPASVPDLPREPQALLQFALQEERACAEELFPAAAKEAAIAGLSRAAEALEHIAETERLHARRFQQYLTALENDTLLRSAERTSWLCLPCGCLHFGCDAPSRCDSCGGGPGQFIRSDFHPFAVRR